VQFKYSPTFTCRDFFLFKGRQDLKDGSLEMMGCEAYQGIDKAVILQEDMR
jgi:hypothetical protein